MNGALDNYLSEDEKSYFDNRGNNEENLEKLEAEVDAVDNNADADMESESESDPSDDTQKQFHSDDVDTQDKDDDEPSTQEDTEEDDDESDSREEAKRDYEKAFKTERHKRKELKENLEAQAKKTSELEEALLQLKNSIAQPAAQATPQIQEVAPDPNEDPLGYQQYQIAQIQKLTLEHNKYLKHTHEMNAAAQQKQAFETAYGNAARQFAEKNADFTDAYKFLTAARVKEHKAAGFNEQEANDLLIEDEMSIVARAFKDKVNPAQRIYNLAKERGFAGATTTKKESPAKNIAELKKGMANSKSLKSGGGQLSDKVQGSQDIDSMDFEEFDTYFNKLKAQAKRR